MEQIIHLELVRVMDVDLVSFFVTTETVNVTHRGSCLVDSIHYNIAEHQ
jgi:hypothetical protein